jgi:hypothetical protein
VQSGGLSVLGTLFCGNGVNINGSWTNSGGNTFQGACDGSGSVTRRVPQDYATIQGAIDASFAGDVVEVGPGTYAEGLNFGGRAITVRSTGGAAVTIVDPVSGRCFTANGQKGPAARLEGFTLRGGSAARGGGVYIESSSPVIVDCVITGNSATASDSGGGVYVASGNPKLVRCTVSLNTGNYAGGGVLVASGSLVLEDCAVIGNSLLYAYDSRGGGIYAEGPVTVSGGEVRGNTAGIGGGVFGGGLTMSGCVVSDNQATYGGGGGIASASLTITGGSVSGNTSVGDGGGLSNVSGQVSGCAIVGNASGGSGGGVWSQGSLTLSSCVLELNDAGGYGGAWYKAGGTASLQNSQVRNNSATTVGGVWVQSGGLSVLGTLFCGNGVNINGSWSNLGGNELNGQCAPFCFGDANGDTYVDAEDIAEVLADWGGCTDADCYSDFDGDGVVGAADLTYVLSQWGRCPGW